MNRVISFLCGAVLLCLGASVDARAGDIPKIVILGDSLTAGYGLPAEDSFPNKLEQYLRQQGVTVEIEGAGVSGDTTGGGLARLDWSVGPEADAVIVELGGNDALRGVLPEQTRANLTGILQRLRERGVPVLLTGMMAPPNMGREYAETFNAIFPDLAAQFEVPLYPFFLDGAAAVPDLNQPDMIHPNARGVEVIVTRIAPHVIALIRDL